LKAVFSGALSEHDVIVADRFRDQTLRVGFALLVAGDGRRRGKGGDDVGITALKIPEVVEVAVGEEDEAAVLRLGVFARLLLAVEGAFFLGLGFKDDERESLFVEEKEVDEALARLLEILTE